MRELTEIDECPGRPMFARSLPLLFSVILFIVVAGCGSGGDEFGASSSQFRCSSGPFCVLRCNLSCSSSGCVITDIAPNQTVEFVFSHPINPATVTNTSFSILTASGEAPNGSLLTSGSTVTFVPRISNVRGVTEFGFVAGETYTLTVSGGTQSQSIRSVSGGALANTISCNLTVSRPLVDPNGAPPTATLLSPATLVGVQPGTTIVVGFDELIDTSPFQGATTATSPILYRLRRTVGSGAIRLCDVTTAAVVLPGVPQVVINTSNSETPVQVSLKPTIPLPAGVCVEVEVTSRVTDLSGKPANQVTYQFITQDSGASVRSIVEDFSSSLKFDSDYSSGRWGNNEAIPGEVGEDGILGDFNVRNGVEGPPNVFTWNTDSPMLIPGNQTMTGQDITVSDGIFRFSRFRLQAGDTLRLQGANPGRFIVRGSVDIEGTISASAPQVGFYQRSQISAGQPGGFGGVGGARGGAGGDAANGMGAQPRFDGQSGEDIRLMAGHAYAGNAAGTGGAGSGQFPASGAESAVTHTGFQNFYSAQIAAGGGGGGGSVAGSPGRALRTTSCPVLGIPPNCVELGPNSVGGGLFDLLPVPTGLPTTVDHFLVGGSGGGGGGSCPFWSARPMSGGRTLWWSGAAGGGGGGIVTFRVGGNLTMSTGASIEARGGDCNTNALPPPVPGGGGGGGTCFLQVGGAVSLGGLLDIGGGAGGVVNENLIFRVETRGGDGAPGFLYLESPSNLQPSALGNTIPVATTQNIGPLTDRDSTVGSQSVFYSTNRVFPPTFLRYELEVDDGGVTVLYSDDPNLAGSSGIASGPGIPVRVLLQGGKVDPTTGVVNQSTIGPWRAYAGSHLGNPSLNNDGATGLRFQIVFDRGVSSTAVVKKFSVIYRS